MLLRAIQPESRHDVAFLGQMLVEAVNWRPGRRCLTLEDVLADPHLARYARGWGRRGDGGMIAEEAGGRVGACWYRLFPADEPGYGFVDERTLELGIAVVADRGDVVSAGHCLVPRCPTRRPKASRPSA